MSSRTSKTIAPLMQRPVQSLLLVIVGVLLITQLPWHRLAGDPDLPGDSQSAQMSQAETGGVLVDVNRAAHRELALLPNVGPVLAQRIVADRSERGPYHSLEDLERVHGIGKKTLQNLSRYCEANVNSSPPTSYVPIVAHNAKRRRATD